MSLELTQLVTSFTSATEVFTAAGQDVTGLDNLGIMIDNTGANPITALAVYWSNDAAGTRWSLADADIATAFTALASSQLAAASVFRIERTGSVAKRVRVVLTAGSATTATVDIIGMQTGVRL